MPWPKRNRAAQVLELQADGLSSNEIARILGVTPKWVQIIANQQGRPFSGRELKHLCMDCKSIHVEGRWQRCARCRSEVAEMGSDMTTHSLHIEI